MKVEELSKDASSLQEQLVMEKSVNDMEKKKNTPEANNERASLRTASNSPTLSLGKVSVADSLGSSFWSQVIEIIFEMFFYFFFLG